MPMIGGKRYRERVCQTIRTDPMTKSFQRAVKESIEWKQKRGLPIAKYDAANDIAYLEYPDGRREIVTAP